MRVISLLQPWASLYVMGVKTIETRSWSTKHRGPLLVHASANKNGIGKQLACTSPFNQYMPKQEPKGHGLEFQKVYVDWDALPFGAIIGMVNLDHVVEFKDIDKDFHAWHHNGGQWVLTKEERAFGDYGDGRYGWLSSGAKQFKKPIPAKGKLLLWNYDIDEKTVQNLILT